jgi:hypothetical protein
LARLLFQNGGLRLSLPEAFETHKRVIQWNARESEDRIPDQALGVDAFTLRLMRWAMTSWGRVSFLNRYLGGTLIPRIELDWLPARKCAAHFILIANNPPENIDDYIDGGRAVQRFWLTATKLNLFIQPEVTPLVFNEYISQDIQFTQTKSLLEKARNLSSRLKEMIGDKNISNAVFMGRIGAAKKPPRARSTRKSLDKLMVDKKHNNRGTSD